MGIWVILGRIAIIVGIVGFVWGVVKLWPKKSATPKLRLEFVEVKKVQESDTHLAAYFDIYNDGSALAKDIILKLELPENVTAAKVGKGWIIESVEGEKRYGVANLMGEDNYIAANSKHIPTIFGLHIPEDMYTNDSKINFQYQLTAEGIPSIVGVVETHD